MTTLPPLIIVADRGHLKAFKPSAQGSGLQLLHAVDFKEGLDKLSEMVTDQAGAFPNNKTNGQGTSSAERMPLVAELEMRSFRKIRHEIEQLHAGHTPGPWAFAAPGEINGAILDDLTPSLRDALTLNLPLDLVNEPVAKLAAHFLRHSEKHQPVAAGK